MEASGGDEHVGNNTETTQSSNLSDTNGLNALTRANSTKSPTFPAHSTSVNGAPPTASLGNAKRNTNTTAATVAAAATGSASQYRGTRPPVPASTQPVHPAYTPEMIRQAQLQMQYLQQQMRMAAAATVPGGIRPGGVFPSSNVGGGSGVVRPPSRPPPATLVRAPAVGPTTARSPVPSSPSLSMSSGIPSTARQPGVALPILGQLHTIPPYNPAMDERAFVESLSRFMLLCNCPLKRIPQMRPDRPMPMLRLFQLVTTFGGYQRVCEANRWTAIAVSMEVTPITPETVAHLQKIYATLLFAYEQVYFLKVPLDRVIWPHQMLAGITASSRSTNASNVGIVGSGTQIPSSGRPPPLSATASAPVSTTKPTVSGVPIKSPPSDTSSSVVGAPASQSISSPGPTTMQSPPTAVSSLPPPVTAPTKRAAPSPATRDESSAKIVPPEPTTETVLRTAHRLKAFARATIAWPRISLEDLTLMLASPSALLVSLALLLLERASATAVDQGPFPGEPVGMITPILDVLCALFLRHFCWSEGEDNNAPDGNIKDPANGGDNCSKSARTMSAGLARSTDTVRPFDWFLRREETLTTDLLRPNRQLTPHTPLNPIMNILRNLAIVPSDAKTGGHSAYGLIMAQHEHLLPRLIIPILTDRRWWPALNLEIYTGAWLILGQVLPHMGGPANDSVVVSLKPPVRLSLLRLAVEDIDFCWEAQHRWTHIVHPASEKPQEPEQLMEFVARLPSRTFSLTSIALRLLGEEGGGDDLDTRTETELDKGFRQIANQLMETLERAALLLFPLAFAYVQDARRQLFTAQTQPITYANVLGRHLHNPQAALPDGGHLELALSGLLILVRRGDRPLDGLLLRTLIGWVDALRSLYVQFTCPRPGTVPYVLPREGTWQSILVVGGPSTLTTHYSHPYRLLILVQDILLSLPPLGPGDLGEVEVSTIIEWVAGPVPGPVHAELLRPAVMERLVNSLLL